LKGLARTVWVSGALAATLPVLLFLPTLGYGFVYDDLPLLGSAAVADLRRLPAYFTGDIDAVTRSWEGVQSNYYRPLFLSAVAAIRVLAGTNPASWHGVVSVLHGVVGLLAFCVLRALGKMPLAALLGSLVFSFHPVHVDSVAWVSGIQDVLLGLFSLSAYLVYLGYASRTGGSRLLGLALLYTLALLSKETAIGLVLLVAAEWGWSRLRGAEPVATGRALAVLGVVTVAYLVLRLLVLGALARPFPSAPAPLLAIASLPRVVAEYLRLLFWPVDLALLSPVRPVPALLSTPALASLGALAASALAAGYWIRRSPPAVLPCLWFLAWLAPCLNLWALNPEWLVMDRYLYLPSLALAWGLLGSAPILARWRLLSLAAVIAVFAGLSLVHMRAYRDERAFWARQLDADPGSSVAWAESGRLALEGGDRRQARRALSRAVELDPASLLPALRLGNLAFQEGDALDAVRRYRSIVERSPGYVPAWKNLPVALDAAGRTQEALGEARRAAALFPGDPDIQSVLGVLLRKQGRNPEAIGAFRAARQAAPGDPTVAFRLALLLAEHGQLEEAREVARQATSLALSEVQRQQLEALLRGDAAAPSAAPPPY